MPSFNGINGEMTFNDLMGLTADGYVRDSTLDQRDGFGPDLQPRAIESFASNLGLVLGPAWYTDFITGTSTLKRSGFRQALQDAQADKFDVLLVYQPLDSPGTGPTPSATKRSSKSWEGGGVRIPEHHLG